MARNFNGGTDRITLLNVGAHSTGCVAFWFKTTQTTSDTILASMWSGTSRNGWGILLNNVANKVGAVGYSGSALAFVINSSSSFNDGSWHHCALNWDGTSGNSNELFVDGASVGSANSSVAWSVVGGVGSDHPIIGRPVDTYWGAWTGDSAEFGYWSRKLTADEVAGLAKGFSPLLLRPWRYAPLVRDYQDRTAAVWAITGTTVSDHPRLFGGVT